MRDNFVQPLAIGFQSNQEMQGRKIEREIQHEAISRWNLRMLYSKGEQLQDKFRELPGVYCIHTIYCFEAREIRNPTLQIVCKSELKWRSYGHLKTTAPSWRVISQDLRNWGKWISQALQIFLCNLQIFLHRLS